MFGQLPDVDEQTLKLMEEKDLQEDEVDTVDTENERVYTGEHFTEDEANYLGNTFI